MMFHENIILRNFEKASVTGCLIHEFLNPANLQKFNCDHRRFPGNFRKFFLNAISQNTSQQPLLTSHPNFPLRTTSSSLLHHVVGQNQHFVFHRKLISWNSEFTFTANLVLVFNKSIIFQRYQLLLNPFIRSKLVDWFLYDNGLID